jgi:hypothetical protein
MKRLAIAAIAVAVLLSCGVASACTSFASYGDTTYYGMNFDYPEGFPVRLMVDSVGRDRIFHLAFMRDGRPIRTSGMSTRGLMASTQELYPQEPGSWSTGPGELFIWEVYHRALNDFENVKQVRELLATKRVVQPAQGKNLHVLVADAHGGALVVEPGDDSNTVTPIDGDYIVMTNFCIGDLAHNEPMEIPGFGNDRYVTARDYLEEHARTLDLDGAFEVLRRTSWHYTRASVVFAPERGEAYVAFERDFDRIVRVSIGEATAETYAGYDEPASWRIGRRGLSADAATGADPDFIARLRRLFGL